MEIVFKDIADKEKVQNKISEMKRQIDLLENLDLTEKMEMNDQNLVKANEIQKAYKNIVSNDWNIKPIKILVAKSDGTEIATIT